MHGFRTTCGIVVLFFAVLHNAASIAFAQDTRRGEQLRTQLQQHPEQLITIRLEADAWWRVVREQAGLSDEQLHHIEQHLWPAYASGLAELAARAVNRIDLEKLVSHASSSEPVDMAAAMQMIADAERSTRSRSDELRRQLIADIERIVADEQRARFDRAMMQVVRDAALNPLFARAAPQDFLRHPDVRRELAEFLEQQNEDGALTLAQCDAIMVACAEPLAIYEQPMHALLSEWAYGWLDAQQAARRARVVSDEVRAGTARERMLSRWRRVFDQTMEARRGCAASMVQALSEDGGGRLSEQSVQLLVHAWTYRILSAYLPHTIGAETVPHLHRFLHAELDLADDVLKEIDGLYLTYLLRRQVLLDQMVERALRDFLESATALGRSWSEPIREIQRQRYESSRDVRRQWMQLLDESQSAILEAEYQKLAAVLDGEIPIDSPLFWSESLKD